MVVVFALIAIMAALGMSALAGMQKRASFGAASNELVTALRRARAEAFGRGVQVAFIIDTVGKRWWSLELPTGLTVATFNPAAPGTLIDKGTLPTGVTFGPTAGYGANLVAPLAATPMTTGAGARYAYCSFCSTSGTNVGFGMVVFLPGNQATFNTDVGGAPIASTRVAEQFTLSGTNAGRIQTMAVAVIGRTGSSQSFER